MRLTVPLAPTRSPTSVQSLTFAKASPSRPFSQYSWTVPCSSASVRNASLPNTRRAVSRPATDTAAAASSAPASSPAHSAAASAVVWVVSQPYAYGSAPAARMASALSSRPWRISVRPPSASAAGSGGGALSASSSALRLSSVPTSALMAALSDPASLSARTASPCAVMAASSSADDVAAKSRAAGCRRAEAAAAARRVAVKATGCHARAAAARYSVLTSMLMGAGRVGARWSVVRAPRGRGRRSAAATAL